jgi:hypothetical protein
MVVRAAMVHADSLALDSMWMAPTIRILVRYEHTTQLTTLPESTKLHLYLQNKICNMRA